MPTYQSIINSAFRLANLVGVDGNASPLIDSKVALEDLFHDAIKAAVVESSLDPAEANALKTNHSVVITSGQGTLPDDVLEEYLDISAMYDDGGTLTGLMSFSPRYVDYIRPKHAQLGYYAIQGSTLFVTAPNGTATGYNGTVHLVATSIPVIPSSPTTQMTISTETAKATSRILAKMLRELQ